MSEDKPGMHHSAPGELFEFARKMRDNPTEAEKRLWEALKNRTLDGYKFRRQHPIGQFIVDFYCHSKLLVIEVDGSHHELEDQKKYDEQRTELLTSAGIREIRFTNEEVLNDFETVLQNIREVLDGLE